MLTITDCATLLQRAAGRPGRLAVLRALGFQSPVGTLDGAAALRLGLDDDTRRAEVAAGRGTLRALLLDVRAGATLRDSVGRAARCDLPITTSRTWWATCWRDTA